MAAKIEYDDIIEGINSVGEEIDTILAERRKEKYFDSIILLYSFIEYFIKWLVFIKLLWNAYRLLNEREFETIRRYVKSLNLYNALHLAMSLGAIDWKLFQRLDSIRDERNDFVHQLWLYAHRGKNLILRKKLEKLANAARDLVATIEKFMTDIGVDEAYEI